MDLHAPMQGTLFRINLDFCLHQIDGIIEGCLAYVMVCPN